MVSACANWRPTSRHSPGRLRPRKLRHSCPNGASSAEKMKKRPPRPRPGSPADISVPLLVDGQGPAGDDLVPQSAQHVGAVDDAQDEEAGQRGEGAPDLAAFD